MNARSCIATMMLALSSALPATALADPAKPDVQPAKASCATLDQVQGSLDDDVDAGIGGLRVVISSPYFSGSSQKGNADDKINMVAHGVTFMKDLDSDNPVPGLAHVLDKLDRATDDMREAVDGLFHWSPGYSDGSGGWNGPSLGLAFPQQGTWDIIDYADEQRQAAYDLVAKLRGSCH